MKTNEDDIPWEPKQECQRVTAINAQKGIDQLQRDCLRFLEIIPDVKINNNIQIKLKLAFPLAPKSNDDVLTKDDFEEGNGDRLLEELGIPAQKPEGKPPPSVCETYKRVVCRYVGAHAQVPSKTASEAFKYGLSALDLARRNTDTIFQSQVSDIEENESSHIQTMKRTIATDELMKKLKDALENSTFGKKFQTENPGILLKELKLGKANGDLFLINAKSGMHPIYGKIVEKTISIVDDLVSHQGAESILAYYKDKKISAFDENGNEVNLKIIVKKYIAGCSDCSFVDQMKDMKSEGSLTMVQENDIPKVLEFADKYHMGFFSAVKRIKWMDFPNFTEKVRTI